MSIFDKYDHSITPQISRGEEVDYAYADPQIGEDQPIVEAPTSLSFKMHMVIALIILSTLAIRLFDVQVVNGGSNAKLAQQHSVRQIIQQSERGSILDSRGVWLARNTSNFRVQVVPGDLPRTTADRAAVYDSLARILGWDDQTKKTWISKFDSNAVRYQVDPLIVKDTVAHDDALLLTQQLDSLPGVGVVAQQVRQYNTGSSDPAQAAALGLAHVLGYVGRVSDSDLQSGTYSQTDSVGKAGIESTYDTDLRGKDGVLQSVVDSKGKTLQTIPDSSKDALPGNNLVLHIDLKLQSIMASTLQDGLNKAGLQSGVAIAMNPQNGAILGMVSLPSFDNNQFSGGVPSSVYTQLTNDPLVPLFDRATQGTFPSGSLIKPFMAAIGLQDGVITENTRIDTPPAITVGPWTFPNWQQIFIPNVDVKTAIAKSNDIFFYAVGGGYDKIKGLGVDRLSRDLPQFGFNQKTGIDLPSESTGRIPNPQWKLQFDNEAWYIGDTYHMSIGQGDLLTTPLQLVTALSAVANGGTLYQPHIVDHEVDQSGKTVKTIDPVVARSKFIDANNIRIVRDGMRQAVTDGSARQLQGLPVPAAGKTGTAQIGVNNQYLESWFEAFAPFDNPQIALVVLGEKGSQQNEGNTTAEPIAKTILAQYFSPDFSK